MPRLSLGDAQLPLTKELIRQRTDTILDDIDLINKGQRYYCITNEISTKELTSIKWKTYLYLRQCVLDYRAGYTHELDNILLFLKDKTNKKWFSERLLDTTEQLEDEKWGSGKHEWLERCLIIDVLKRSAGMIENCETGVDVGCIFPEIDWLYIQATIRSPTKYVLFRNDELIISTGHAGAIKPNLEKTGFASKGSPGFHNQLVEAFKDSYTIEGFLKKIRNIFKSELYSGNKFFNPSADKKYLVDGSSTKDEVAINQFRTEKLRPDGYASFKELLFSNIEYATHLGDRIKEDISDIASESEEELAELDDFAKLGI